MQEVFVYRLLRRCPTSHCQSFPNSHPHQRKRYCLPYNNPYSPHEC